jgi:hypothetical protein
VKFPLLPFALTLLLALPISPVFAAAGTDDLVGESVDRLGLQTEMPDLNLGPLTETPDPNLGPRTEAPDPNSRPQTDMPDPESRPQTEMPSPAVKAPDHGSNAHAASDLIRFLLWGGVIIGILVIVWSMRDSLPFISRSRKIIAPEQPPPPLAQSRGMEEAQVEADDLARQGHYGEAMHMLLLKSLNEIRRQLGASFAVSLTSREILRRVQLPDIGRQSLAAIIRSVERTYFGSEGAGQSDYSECRSNFETLRRSLATVAAT